VFGEDKWLSLLIQYVLDAAACLFVMVAILAFVRILIASSSLVEKVKRFDEPDDNRRKKLAFYVGEQVKKG
jgi:hypothetical protein